MQLSLRQAIDLKERLDRRYLSAEGSKAISIYEPDFEASIATERADALSHMVLADRLASIGCQLGKEIARQEAAIGINDVLEDRDRLRNQKRRLEELAECRPSRIEIVRGRLDTIRRTGSAGSSAYEEDYEIKDDELKVDVLTRDDLTNFRQQLADVSHQLHGLTEQLHDLNGKTKVQISDADAGFLREQGLV